MKQMKLCMGCMEYYDDELTVCPHCGFGEDFEPDNSLHLEPGTILADRYVVGKVIGFGGFGVTYIGRDALLETKIAIKEYLPSEFSTRALGQTVVTVFGGDKGEQFEDGRHKFIDEAKKLARFHSMPGIVKVYDSFEYNNTAYIVMELLEGETLAQRLKREKTIPEDEAVKMMVPVIRSLEEVHKEGIIHRDIAPDNLFVTKSGDVKLIDFGAARYATTTHSRSLTVIIKPGYSPEEQYRSRGDQGAYTDVYALAATMYKMITGQTPPDALERRAFFENKKKDILPPLKKYRKDVSENHETAILNALNVRIEDRTPDMASFLAELQSETPVKRRYGKIKKLDIMKIPLWAKASIATAAVIAVIFGVLVATGVIHIESGLNDNITIPEGHTRVPTVINSEYESGEDRLRSANLIMEIEGKEPSEKIPENLILTQEIDGGLIVADNTVVGVKVSASVIKQVVPDVVGLNADEAKKKLQELGFQVTTTEVYDNTISKGSVVSQSAEAYSEIAENSTIELKVSKGRDPSAAAEVKDVTVPKLIGLDYNDAIKKAKEYGITLNIKERKYSKSYAKNKIMEQDPASGKTIKNTTPISLVVSLGFEKVEVPDVVLMTEEKAKAQLSGRGLKCKVEYKNDETVASGLVISQNPKKKTMADVETEVVIVVSKGASSFAIPSVVGQDEDAATKALTAKGLSVTVTYAQNDSADEGTVLAQSIAAGTKVKRGDAVTITVCTHSNVVNVPNVVGRTQGEAENAITSAGLKVTVNYANSSVEKGRVISQSPESGSGLNKGSTVIINVSSGKAESPAASSNVTSSRKEAASKPAVTSSKKNESPSSNTASKTTSSKTASTNTSSVKSEKTPSRIEPASVDIDVSTILMVIGEWRGLSPTVSPSNAYDKSLTWKSADESVATVSSGGRVEAVGEGETTITVTTVNGKTDTCTVKVTPRMAESITLSKETLQLDGVPDTLTATIKPDNTADKTVTWESSNESVAVVSPLGFVTPLTNGQTTITARTSNGLTATCEVTVTGMTSDDIKREGTIKVIPDREHFISFDSIHFIIRDNSTGLYATSEGWISDDPKKHPGLTLAVADGDIAESFTFEFIEGHDLELIVYDSIKGAETQSRELTYDDLGTVFSIVNENGTYFLEEEY